MVTISKKIDPSDSKQYFSNFLVMVHCCRYWLLKEWELTNMAFPFWRLYYNTLPGAKLFYNDKEYLLDCSKVIIIPPNTSYASALRECACIPKREGIVGERIADSDQMSSIKDNGWVDHLFIHFNLGTTLDIVQPGIYEIELTKEFKSKLSRIQRTCIENGFSDISGHLHLYSTITELVAQLPSDIWQLTTLDNRIANIMRYIDKNVEKKLSNDCLAARANMATNSFARLFKSALGESLQHYITRKRLEKSQQLLHHTNNTIDQIAFQCGFCDRHHFTRAFKFVFGITPVAYKKIHNYDSDSL